MWYIDDSSPKAKEGGIKMKRIVCVLLVVSALFLLCACGSSGNLSNQTGDSFAGSVSDNTASENQNSGSVKAKVVSFNEPFSVGDVMEITLTNSEWCDTLYPSNTSGTYSYYENVDGETYFVVRGSLKSFASQSFDVDYCSKAQLLINNKYKVPVWMELEELDGTSFYGEVKPLQTLNMIMYSSVSDELYNVFEEAELDFSIVSEDEYLVYFYDEEYPQEYFTMSLSK